MKHTILAALLATTMLAGCTAVTSEQGGTSAEEVGTEWFGINKPDAITVTNGEALKGKNEVYLGGFTVTFLEEKRASNKAGGGLMGSGFGGKASAKMALTGVTPKEMQAITEAAYADFTVKMQKGGYTFLDRKDLLTSDDFKDTANEASPQRTESSWLGSDVTQTEVAPQAIGRIYSTSPMHGGFAFSNPMIGASSFALKHKPVVFVNYIIDFANKSGGHGSSWSQSASVQVGQGISVAPGSQVQWVGGTSGTFNNNAAQVGVGQPISVTDTFGEVIGTTTDAEAGLETAVNVLGALGGIGTNQTREFEVKADPAKYQAVTGKALTLANDKIVGTMVGLK